MLLFYISFQVFHNHAFVSFASLDPPQTQKKTRLISIVSKPILIVVVVIDVVFVKKKLGPKKFWLKKIHVLKTLCQNNFG